MRFVTFCLLLALPVIAGPVGNFRLENGGVVKAEVMHVDENYYYCRKVADRTAEFTVKVENVPSSFRRRVDQLRQRGEIAAPPAGDAKTAADNPLGDWSFTDYRKLGNTQAGRVAEIFTRDNMGRDTRLVIRSRYNKLEAFLMFEDEVTMIRKWQITYRLDGGEEIKEHWINSENRRTLFSPTPLSFRDKRLRAKTLSVRLFDKQGEERQMRFNVVHFDKVHAQFSD